MIDLTIVIPSYETRALLVSCLESIEVARSAHPELSVETIVVDNGSSDGTAQEVVARAARLTSEPTCALRCIACVRNRGFAAAVNRALLARRGRMVLLLNSDVVIGSDLLTEGFRILEDHPEIGVVGATLRNPDGSVQRSEHRLPSLWTELVPEFAGDWLRRAVRAGPESSRFEARSGDAGLRRVEAVRGAVFFIRGKLLEELGLLDESFFFFLEETEFCDRVRRAGHQVVCAGEGSDLEATHHLGASSKRRAAMATRIEFHRSLYRYLEMRHGKASARTARLLRTLRGGLLVLGLAALAGFSSRQRRRLPERWGLFLWHLRGCPAEPRLADVLATSAGRIERMGTKRELDEGIA